MEEKGLFSFEKVSRSKEYCELEGGRDGYFLLYIKKYLDILKIKSDY